MTIELARAAFAQLGHVESRVEPLAEGASSTAWVAAVDGVQFVVRTPATGERRPRPRYAMESVINRTLRDRGVPAPATQVLDVGGVTCTAAPRLGGSPVRPGEWSTEFVVGVAEALHRTHSTPTQGWGAPVEGSATIRGESRDGAAAACQRFWLARIWPFDGTELAEHPVASLAPERVRDITFRAAAIRREAERAPCLVHTDLHWDHLLRDAAGRLCGLLDFGAATLAPAAWDFACLRYYHGADVTRRVADATPGGDDLLARSDILGTAFALYKLDKTPTRPDVIERVLGML